jgi:preprotein translocase SecE subunit
MSTVRNENAMATNLVASDADEPDKDDGDSKSLAPVVKSSSSSTGPVFFTIYKKGQGKWTRLGTVFVAALLGILSAFNLYQYILPYLPTYTGIDETARLHHDQLMHQILLGVSVGFLIVFAILTFWLTNKPRNVDFLIATDSEMKKVNWTTQGELMGSTRVVVLFLFFIAIFLSVVDLVFYELFHFIKVLE